jgi:hypothetical protein
VRAQAVDQRRRQHGSSTFGAFTVADVNLAILEVDVLHSQFQRLEQAKANSVQEPNDPGRRSR